MGDTHQATFETFVRPTRTAERARPTFDEIEADALLAEYRSSEAPREVPRAALAGAVASWFALVYALCYVALPAIATAFGTYSGMVPNLIVNTLAFAPLAAMSVALVAVVRPKVVLRGSARRDPILSAAGGSLLVWFLAHQALLALQPITAMPLVEAATFTGINLVEHGLLGMMLGSFVRTPAQAFALGAAFQAMFLSLFLGWVL